MAVWSVVKHSYVNLSKRIDSDFYRPGYLDLEVIFSKACLESGRIKDVAKEIPDKFSKKSCSSNIQYNDISTVDTITGQIAENLILATDSPGRATFLNRENDLLISTVRPNRNANAIVDENEYLQVGSNGFCNLRAFGIDPFYLFIYSKTKYFREYLERFCKSSMYPAVSNEDILQFPLFRPNDNIIEEIALQTKSSRYKLRQSQSLYTQAQHLLEQELGLDKLTFEKPVGYEARFSEVSVSHRLDAQHFRIKYNKLISQIKKYDWQIIRNLKTYNRRGIQPVYIEASSEKFVGTFR